MHPASLPDDALLKHCSVTTGRVAGPGGQHRNKVETHVEIRHEATGLIGQAGERRSQIENKRVALKRLRLLLATAHREPVPRGEIGSPLWRSRLKPPTERGTGGRIACNPDHADYPTLLAEALDAIAAAGWDHSTAAVRLDVSPSQLIKLIKDHPPALAALNAERAKAGMRRLQ